MDELNSETFERNFLKHALSKMLTKEELVEYCLELIDQQKEDEKWYERVLRDHGILIEIKNHKEKGILTKAMSIA